MEKEDIEVDYEVLDKVPASYGLYAIGFSVLIFQLQAQAVRKFLEPPVNVGCRWKWRNLVVSWLQALIISAWDLSSFYIYLELTTDLIAYHNTYLYSMVAFCTGYFIHDCIDIIVNRKFAQMWEIVLHHAAVAGLFFCHIVTTRCIGYSAVLLLAEVNSIFLLTRTLLRMCRVNRSHFLYKLNACINLLTFLLFRFGSLVIIAFDIFYSSHRLTTMYLYFLTACIFVIWVSNVNLFLRLLTNDFKELRNIEISGAVPTKTRQFVDIELTKNESAVNGEEEELWNNEKPASLRRKCAAESRLEKEKETKSCTDADNGKMNGACEIDRSDLRQRQQ